MSRKLRLEYPGAIYHIINRGNYRTWIFKSEGAKESFEQTLFAACDYAGWILHAYVVMGNHFHLAVETPEPNLSEGMRWLQGVFATRFNRYRKENGRLFQGRFKSLLVEGDERLSWLCHYIHLNPVRARICEVTGLKEYRYGSYWYLRKRKKRPEFLDMDTCLTGAGQLVDSSYGWRRYEAYLQWLCEDEPARKSMLFDRMSRGWAMGTRKFKESLLKDEKGMRDAIALGVTDAQEARELAWSMRLNQCLKFMDKRSKDLEIDAKSAPWKAALAAHLKTRMLCRNGWLGRSLKMGTESGVCRHANRALKGEYKEATKLLNKLNARFKE